MSHFRHAVKQLGLGRYLTQYFSTSAQGQETLQDALNACPEAIQVVSISIRTGYELLVIRKIAEVHLAPHEMSVEDRKAMAIKQMERKMAAERNQNK